MAAPSDKNEIYLSSSPHYSFPIDTQKLMFCVIFSLLPLCVAGVVFFGIPALITILVSTVSCVVFEWLFRKITKQPSRVKDTSAAVTGIMLALVLPPSTPIWMTILGSLMAIVVAKEFFGGLGMNVFNPALIGRAFLFVSFPAAMGTWTMPFDATTGATPLTLGPWEVDYKALFLGTTGGSIGETSAMLILIAFAFLAVTRVIDWRAPVAMVVTCVVFEYICDMAGIYQSGDPLFALLTGGLLFGAVFMTTDYATAPVTENGRLIFGFGCGLITGLIRVFGGYPEGVMFSILIMNALVAFLNRLTGKKYGQVTKGKATK